MIKPAPNTPVIVGVGSHQEKNDDPAESSEAVLLMIQAARLAAADAGSTELLPAVESISVPQGLWQYRNPGALIGEAIGSPNAKCIVSDLGVLQLTPLSDLCRAIVAGEQEVGLAVGGEAKYRDLRSRITSVPVSDTEQGDDVPPPDVRHTSDDPFCSDLESQRGLVSPIALFSIIDSSLRHEQGLSVDEHRDELGRLYSTFSEVAAANPHAWSRAAISAEEIREAGANNAMQAFPYTKRHCSQWNVNSSVAILVCSARKAEQLGIDRAKWIFPVAAAESKHVVVLAQQRKMHSHPGTVLAGRRAFEMAGVSADEITAAELYSCFPAAVRSFAHDLGLGEHCPLSVTGAMPFAGGPFNHFSLDGVARMVEVLRDESQRNPEQRTTGLVTNLSGIFGKQQCAIFSNIPNPGGYSYEDVTAEVAKINVPVELDAAYVGRATVAGYTVVFEKGVLSHGVVICDTPTGHRTVGRSDDPELLDRITQRELCGTDVEISPEGTFTCTAAGIAAAAD